MQIDVRKGRIRVEIGPPGGPTETIAASCDITVTGTEPYDVQVRLEFVPSEGKLSIREMTYSAHPGGVPVRVANINRLALGSIMHDALYTAFLGGEGWPGLIDRHDGTHDQVAVDALVYLMAVALDSPKPSATVATARGLSPASGPKRVAAARKAGLLPETAPGKAAGA